MTGGTVVLRPYSLARVIETTNEDLHRFISFAGLVDKGYRMDIISGNVVEYVINRESTDRLMYHVNSYAYSIPSSLLYIERKKSAKAVGDMLSLRDHSAEEVFGERYAGTRNPLRHVRPVILGVIVECLDYLPMVSTFLGSWNCYLSFGCHR